MLIKKHASKITMRCCDCGVVIGLDEGPKDGWQVEDGRTVCHKCCAKRFNKDMESYTVEIRGKSWLRNMFRR